MSPIGILVLVVVWSAAVWAGASLICTRRPSPRLAQAIWRGAAGLMLAPFFAAALVPGLPQLAAAPLPDMPVLEPFFVHPGETGVLVEAAPQSLPATGTLLLAVIAGGWASRLALWLFSQFRLQALKARAYPVRRPVGHWAEAMGLTRVPDIYVIPRGAPFLAGLWRPAIFVPSALISGRDAGQILVHELVHLKRGDLITRPLERLVADLFWFTPFAWAMRERLDYWREVVVDETAAELTGDRIAYARALTNAARLARPVITLPVAAFILPRKGTLKMRLNELLTAPPHRPRRFGLILAGALALATPLALAQGILIKGSPALPAASGLAYSHAVLDKAKLTSTFGERKHPITGETKHHNGVDLAEEEGKPIYAPTAGTVTRAEFTDAYGNLVEVASGDTTLRFGQLQEMRVAAGDTVVPGQTIATLGQTGKATGPHLHLEVWRNGAAVDPQAEDGLVLAEVLRVQAGAAPLAPKPAPGVKPTSMPAAAPAPAPRLIPASAPQSSAAPAAVTASTATAPSECPDKGASGHGELQSVS